MYGIRLLHILCVNCRTLDIGKDGCLILPQTSGSFLIRICNEMPFCNTYWYNES